MHLLQLSNQVNFLYLLLIKQMMQLQLVLVNKFLYVVNYD